MSARDDRRPRFTCRDGSGKASSMGQLAVAAEVGFLLFDYEAPSRGRVGRADRIDDHADRLMQGDA